jgi:cobalt/nickel transport system permease protein
MTTPATLERNPQRAATIVQPGVPLARPARRDDARVRLALALGASVTIALLGSPAALLWLLAAGAAGCAVAIVEGSLRLAQLARRLLAVNAFLVLVWLTLPLEFGRDGLAWSAPGIELAALISARANAIALAVCALLAGLDAHRVARAAAALGLPAKGARLMLLMVRYVAVIGETWRRLDRAARARGFVPRADRRTLAVLAQLLALLLAHALLRAERVDLALRARAWSGARHAVARTGVPRADWAWAAATLAALAVALAIALLA